MSDLDDRIREALAEEEKMLSDASRNEPGLWQMYFASFKGRNRSIVILVNLEILIFFIILVFALVNIFRAEELTLPVFQWSVGGILSCICIVALKLWLWMEMNKNASLREIKRMELQLARLTEKLAEK